MKHIKRSQWLREPQIIGHRRDGSPVFSIGGGATDDDPQNSSEEDEDEDDGDDEDEEEEQDDDSKNSGKGSSSETVTREEFEQVVNRMKAADKRASKAEKALADKERKERSDVENMESDLATATQERDSLKTENQDLKVRLAVALSPEAQKFHDVEDALVHLKVGDLTDEDGDVDTKKVTEALKALAERKKHLVKSESEEDGDEEDERTPPPSGSPFNGKKKRKDGLDRETLAQKYPALRR